MQTTITQRGPVEYQLEIKATADDLADDLNRALRKQRGQTHMKGFRPGKVPLPIVKKMYGKALAFEMVDKLVQEAYEDLVLEADEHEVLGQPKITTLDYEMDGDLHAVIEFGVRPEIAFEDLTGESVDTMVHDVTDEEIDEEIERLREGQADLIPVEDEPIEDADFVVFDLQELDAATRAPLIGKRDEDQQLFLDDERLDASPLMSALKTALIGAKTGDAVHFHFEHDQAHGGLVEPVEHAHVFEATVKEVKRREIPELDDDFVQEYTKDRLETVEAFREEIETQLKNSWEQRIRGFLEENIIEKMLELHPVPVPESVIDLYTDSYVEDVKQRNRGQLPPNFSVEAFKNANQEEAEKQARWMLLRDKLIKTEELAVSDEDVDAFFEKEAEKDDNLNAEQLRQFYEQVKLIESLEHRLMNQKVFDLLAERFELVEKDSETVEQEMEQRRAEALAKAEAEVAAAEAAVKEAEAAMAQAQAEAEAFVAEAEATPEAEPEPNAVADEVEAAEAEFEAALEAASEPDAEAAPEPDAAAEAETKQD